MKCLRSAGALAFLWVSVVPAWSVVVNFTAISEGEPVPGTTISLETIDGTQIPLEIEELTFVEIVEENSNVVESQPTSTGTNEPVTTVVTEVEPQSSTQTVEKKTVYVLPADNDGTAELIVDDKYKSEPLILVIRDKAGKVLEKKSVFLTGATTLINVASLPNISINTAQSSSASSSQSASTQTTSRPSVKINDRVISSDNGSIEIEEEKPNYSIGIEFEYGNLKRNSFNALRLQTGGGATILMDTFASANRSDSFTSFAIDGYGDLGRKAPIYNTNLYAISSFRYAQSSVSSYQTNVSTGGYDLGILSPHGPTGGLGGGVNVNSPASDLNFVSYHDDYSELLALAGVMTMIEHNGISFTKGASLFYGRTSETLSYDGRTNNNTLDFEYDAKTTSNRFGIQLSTEAEHGFSDYVTGYAGLDLRFVHNSGSSDARLALSGALNATESAHASSNKFDVGAVVQGGVRVHRKNVNLDFGGRFETWKIPVARITGEQPLYIDYESRNSFSVFAKFNLKF